MRRVLGNPSLRRLELAFLGFVAAEMGVWVAVLVYAYQHGGTTMAAVIAAIQLVPAAALAPAAVEVADRHGRAVTLAASYAIQAGALLGTGAAFLLGAPSLIGYACATVAASAVTLTRPAQAALVPQLVRTPSELTAANVTSGWVESASMLVGPALAGALISLDGPGLAVAGFGVVLVACALAAEGLEHQPAAPARSWNGMTRCRMSRIDSGLLALCLRERPVTALLGLFFVQFVAFGSLDVLVVVLALKQLHLGSSGAGYLESMFGLGTVLGAFVAVGLVGQRRLSAPVLIAAVIWGGSLLLMAGLATAGAVFGLLVVIGASRTVFDVGGRTLLHRAVPPRVHGRMFGVLEGSGDGGARRRLPGRPGARRARRDLGRADRSGRCPHRLLRCRPGGARTPARRSGGVGGAARAGAPQRRCSPCSDRRCSRTSCAAWSPRS